MIRHTPSEPRCAVVCGLLAGYGAEDIVVMDGLPCADVRAEIARLRAEGRIRWIVSHAQQRAGRRNGQGARA